ncbi:hypothetical protein DMH27_14225 [Raoultella planticola]|nr:hypothetical protein [Raoultella planticola]
MELPYGQNTRRDRRFSYPTIGFAVDHHKQQDAAWAPIFQSFEPLRWLDEKTGCAGLYLQ